VIRFVVGIFFLLGGGAARIGRAHFHPRRQIGDLVVVEFFVLGHLQIRIGVTNRLDEQARFRITRHNRQAAVAAFEQRFAAVEQQAAFDFFRKSAVTLVAMVGKNGPDFAFKKFQLRRCRLNRECALRNYRSKQNRQRKF